MKKIIGVLAHVDAGKTTFCEQVLCHVQALRKPGRVDHGDAFLDDHPLEKARGITIFSEQAHFAYEGDEYYLVDTPGHVDFSSEMERALAIMDYAILIISSVEGIQSHTRTVWKLLAQYDVPVFLFLNKTDRTGADPSAILRNIRKELSADVLALDEAVTEERDLSQQMIEAIAERDEELLDVLFSKGYSREKWLTALRRLIRNRKIFPLMRGAALRGEGIAPFWETLALLTETSHHEHVNDAFQARVARIRFDAQGDRLAFLKLESGTLSSKDAIATVEGSAKVNELRLYSGAKYRAVSSASAGDIVAAVGLARVRPGDTIGSRPERCHFHLTPLMTVRVLFPAEIHPIRMLEILRRIEEEEPTLAISWNEQSQSIELQVMGKIQLEILRDLVARRSGIDIDFGPRRIRYLETIAQPVCGIGHYEPLRHYAEVHLKLEPTPAGSGITFESRCHVDDLALNWQRLIETHVFEYAHKGVLTGAPLTDVQIVLLAGRAHLKHTEGGDFRQATYRAIRNALMQAKSLLLEPVCRFEIATPSDLMGRVLSDLGQMHASLEQPILTEGDALLAGDATFARISAYQDVLTAITHGRGSLAWQFDHYVPCEDAEAVIAEAAYDPLADDTPDSVFCARGAGYNVPWDEVRQHAHIKSEANC